jgi:hypothetical protein
MSPLFDILEFVGLKPYIPFQADGNLIEPARSLPIASGAQRVEITPALPPELPPTQYFSFHGFLATPHKLVYVL